MQCEEPSGKDSSGQLTARGSWVLYLWPAFLTASGEGDVGHRDSELSDEVGCPVELGE